MDTPSLNRKRRRVEQSTTALSKPFKSPLRRPALASNEVEASPKDKEIASASNLTPQATPTGGGNAHDPQKMTTPTFETPTTLTTPSPCSKRKIGSKSLTPTKRPINSDPKILDLRKQQHALQSQLALLRSELDTAQQALRIESSNGEEELKTLIKKWKTVSQNAAEEVFAGAQERITRMGGMNAWGERTKNDNARWEQEEMESWFGHAEAEGRDLDLDDLEAREAERKDQVGEGGEEEDAAEPEEFTMDLMLKMLNIGIETIGFDNHMQRWNKE